MDIMLPLGAQPALMARLVQLLAEPETYGVLLLYGAGTGIVSPSTSLPDVNPLSLLGMLLLTASAVAPVPVGLGLGCLGIWISLQAGQYCGAKIGVSVRQAIADLTMVTAKRAQVEAGRIAVLLLATAGGRRMIAGIAAPALGLGLAALALHLRTAGSCLVAIGLVGIAPILPAGRRALWRNARRWHRRGRHRHTVIAA